VDIDTQENDVANLTSHLMEENTYCWQPSCRQAQGTGCKGLRGKSDGVNDEDCDIVIMMQDGNIASCAMRVACQMTLHRNHSGRFISG
jgi:hypothetical protein